ncbi:hypothetical protein N7456_010890 [Penicillium angulare]|uniref:Uncharacterized protein n=1 Tax=Penicillium angulare TaxID=116970 RepID=A0A9W9ESW9_9EURO|nr:hypothetical protein N7456_010890 [Penicillium angulare]
MPSSKQDEDSTPNIQDKLPVGQSGPITSRDTEMAQPHSPERAHLDQMPLGHRPSTTENVQNRSKYRGPSGILTPKEFLEKHRRLQAEAVEDAKREIRRGKLPEGFKLLDLDDELVSAQGTMKDACAAQQMQAKVDWDMSHDQAGQCYCGGPSRSAECKCFSNKDKVKE